MTNFVGSILMIYPYLIEFRLRGNAKNITKKFIFDIYKKFKVKGAVRKRPVPHVTLFGPFATKSIRDVKQIIREVGHEYSRLDYEITGFDFFERKVRSFLIPKKKKHVIYLQLRPDSNMQEFRHALAKKLFAKTKSQNIDFDKDSKFQFHATLAMKDIHHKFDDIWNYLKVYSINTKGVCYRITLLNKGRIICEYDVVQKRFLNRGQALSRHYWKITERLLAQQSNLH